MSFENEGWLGEEARGFAQHCEEEFAPNLALARRTNVLAHEVLRELSIDSHNPQHLLAAALFVRLLQSTQAAVHLIVLGLRHDSAAIIRVSIESLILLANSCRDRAFGRRYVASGSKKTLLRTNRGLPNATRDGLDAEMRTRLGVAEAQHGQIIDTLGRNSDRLEQLAIDVGLGELYDTVYRLYSASVHSEAGIVASCYEVQANSMVMNYNPDWEYTGAYLSEVCRVLLYAIASVEELFGTSHSDGRVQLAMELEKLSPQWPDPKRKSV
jgi:hypothetical protein